MGNIPNPYDVGIQPGYPIISLYNKVSKLISEKTFNNLNNFLTPNFIHKSSVILIGNDISQMNVQMGVWSAFITVKIPAAYIADLTISAKIDPLSNIY
jgi:hypothetical protein